MEKKRNDELVRHGEYGTAEKKTMCEAACCVVCALLQRTMMGWEIIKKMMTTLQETDGGRLCDASNLRETEI